MTKNKKIDEIPFESWYHADLIDFIQFFRDNYPKEFAKVYKEYDACKNQESL